MQLLCAVRVVEGVVVGAWQGAADSSGEPQVRESDKQLTPRDQGRLNAAQRATSWILHQPSCCMLHHNPQRPLSTSTASLHRPAARRTRANNHKRRPTAAANMFAAVPAQAAAVAERPVSLTTDELSALIKPMLMQAVQARGGAASPGRPSARQRHASTAANRRLCVCCAPLPPSLLLLLLYAAAAAAGTHHRGRWQHSSASRGGCGERWWTVAVQAGCVAAAASPPHTPPAAR